MGLGVFLATTVVLLLALEGVFRLLDLRGFYEDRGVPWNHALLPMKERARFGYNYRFKPNSTWSHNYDSNPTGYFDENNGLEYSINKWMVRGPDFPLRKPPGVRRTLILGDSFAFGEGVKWEHTTGERLEALLNAAGGPRHEVINAAIPAWITPMEITYLKAEGFRFEPDHVMVAYCLNDAVNENVYNNVRKTYENRHLKWSYLASWVYGRFARLTYRKQFVQKMRTGWKERELDKVKFSTSMRALSRGLRACKKRGVRFTVFIYPFMLDLAEDYPFVELHAEIVKYCQENGIEVFDLYPFYAGRDAEALWVHPSDPHPNVEGHEIAARALADYLTQKQ